MRSRSSLCMLLALALLWPGIGFAASSDAAVSGVVRDAHGTPQMGALVQLLTADATIIATAFTDNHGRYLIPTVLPGRYELRATAAFFLPATRQNIRLEAGAQAIINLTMSTLYEAENWLPAQKRLAGEPADDWKWTLRSTANRPLLRLTDDDDDATVQLSSSAESNQRATTHARMTVTSGDGGFGQGGVHQVLILDRAIEDGDGAILRADVGGPRIPFPVAPAAEITAGYQRRSLLGGVTRLVGSYQSHPELTDGTAIGAQVFRLASTQEFKFGDLVVLDTGAVTRIEHVRGSQFSSEPFVRLVVRPSSGWIASYRYAAGRELQSSEDLDRLKPALQLLTDGEGNPLSVRGSHHEVSLSRKLGKQVLEVAAYTDSLDHARIGGGGIIDAAVLAHANVLADPTTGTFALATSTYTGRGLSVSLVQPLTPSMAAWFSYDAGTALVAESSGPLSLASVSQSINRRNSYAATASLRGKILRSGTTLRAEYRWQPEHTLTQVNAFNATDQEAYLGLYLRQRVWCGKLLPDGIDAVIDASNLLAQGYQPVISSDGRVLFLAQVPRAIQGGFAFNF